MPRLGSSSTVRCARATRFECIENLILPQGQQHGRLGRRVIDNKIFDLSKMFSPTARHG